MSSIELLIIAGVIIGIIWFFLQKIKKLAINTIIGLIALYILNQTIFLGNEIPIKIWTVTITALLGVLGVFLLVLAKLFYLI